MRFGPVSVDQALGAVLAHSVHLPTGRLRKGQVLEAAHLDMLAAAGLAEITVARLDPADVAEDAAALRLARALVAGSGLRIQPVGTGRVNIHAEGPGLLRVAAQAVHALNAVDPMITVATVPEWQRLESGTMAATVKIIAYAVAGAALERACQAGQGALSLCPPVLHRAVLIETLIGDGPAPPKGARVTAARLERLGMRLEAHHTVPHRADALADRLRQVAGTDLILILTGSATSDPMDVAPQAVRQAGGQVDHVGMPVDPGNLLFVGRLGPRPVIGLPGCARSPALNGADWVLERVACGLTVGADQITRMGVGGLLTEIPTRPRPRTRAEPRPDPA
ncbi:molybdenum cofactor cytidylyltransferase [Gemmobacter megaterium]|uniref:Molybdenum cofactor cytidylyltransferase n=1 Tax=Gemmobacter megaterium TaxID=1086013 RepID=A0A1N7KK61_9RHOB|nr:molybdopterin-binding protein [Gemmobacter megaterium]GGE02615.1 molybdopterin biosynthesis protein [Gemmobacter megaterium]SIS61947.1 molybdenum cofactor cytidylyltransferase [Gemmobacter megaterium]